MCGKMKKASCKMCGGHSPKKKMMKGGPTMAKKSKMMKGGMSKKKK